MARSSSTSRIREPAIMRAPTLSPPLDRRRHQDRELRTAIGTVLGPYAPAPDSEQTTGNPQSHTGSGCAASGRTASIEPVEQMGQVRRSNAGPVVSYRD